MSALEAEVERKLAATFAEEQERAEARKLLLEYGTQSWQRESERVRLAMIKVSHGSLDELRRAGKAAGTDYRDVLMWAEYPEEARTIPCLETNLDEKARDSLARMHARDRKQYEEWRKK
jgi:hypothetical protein